MARGPAFPNAVFCKPVATNGAPAEAAMIAVVAAAPFAHIRVWLADRVIDGGLTREDVADLRDICDELLAADTAVGGT